jgi:hypothetical protein
MSNYRPDHWMLVKIEGTDPHYRVFGSWIMGNPFNGDDWRLNSGIVSVTEDDKKYYFDGHSGSTYECLKDAYGTTPYGAGILKSYAHDLFIPMNEQPTDIMEMDWII